MSTFDGFIAEFPSVRIDAFSPLPSRPAGLVFLLSHVHTDHLRGLLSFRSPFIYCTHATRQLLLRLETHFHRLNHATGLLSSRRASYAHLSRVLRPLALGVPTALDTRPGERIRVTALDANHCPGACMFLLQDGRRSVLYTGDVRAETWWVERLGREPVLVPFATGLRTLDCVYLDTTFAVGRGAEQWRVFPQRREGLEELLRKVDTYPSDTVFYFDTWTWGYEEAWVALANYLGTRVHVDDYRWRLYRSLAEGEGAQAEVYAPLVGYQTGNRWQPGCLTRDDGEGVRIHSCERGMGCEVFKDPKTVHIRAIITRHKGIEYTDNGEGGGYGDLNQMHELEASDVQTLGKLMQVCSMRLKHRPEVLSKVTAWLAGSIKKGARNIKLDAEAFHRAMEAGGEDDEGMDVVPIERLVIALDALVEEKAAEVSPPKRISFPYSRHASLEELRHLVRILQPGSVFPNTFEAGMDMDALFGDLLAKSKDEASRPAADETRGQAPAPSKRPMVEERAATRHKAYRAALNPRGRGWSAIELISVNGYHIDEEHEL